MLIAYKVYVFRDFIRLLLLVSKQSIIIIRYYYCKHISKHFFNFELTKKLGRLIIEIAIKRGSALSLGSPAVEGILTR